jgi:hypothetical protein
MNNRFVVLMIAIALVATGKPGASPAVSGERPEARADSTARADARSDSTARTEGAARADSIDARLARFRARKPVPDTLAVPIERMVTDTTYFPLVHLVPDSGGGSDTSLVFLFETGNRLYPDWKEEHRVRLEQPFYIGDTEFHAVATRFLPDFRLVNGKPGNASREMRNPAVRVMTYRDTVLADSAWAFLNFPPHFAPRAFFTFRLREISGPDGAVLAKAPDAAPPGEGGR